MATDGKNDEEPPRKRGEAIWRASKVALPAIGGGIGSALASNVFGSWLAPVLGILIIVVPLLFGEAKQSKEHARAWYTGGILAVAALFVVLGTYGYKYTHASCKPDTRRDCACADGGSESHSSA